MSAGILKNVHIPLVTLCIFVLGSFLESHTWADGQADLPALQTDQGTLIRLLLAESSTPLSPGYDRDEVLKGMKAMKAVVDNRLHNKPGRFGAGGAANYRDVIGADGKQFQGFSNDDQGQIAIASYIQSRLDDIINRANKELGPAFGPFTELVQFARSVADAPVQDPFASLPSSINGVDITGGAYGWVTEGSASPGGAFFKIPDANGGLIAGNRFYTLSK